MRWVLGIGAVLMAGCVRVGPGIRMTELPPGIAWCEGAPRTIASAPLREESKAPLVSAWLLNSCSRFMRSPELVHTEDVWHGSIVFGLSTDQTGQLTNICAFGGNFGNTTDYVACIQDTLMKSGIVLPQNLKVTEWTLTYVID